MPKKRFTNELIAFALDVTPETSPRMSRVRSITGDGRMKKSRFTEEQIIAILREQGRSEA